jgi:uncharacterized protein YecE (DUF72 family)
MARIRVGIGGWDFADWRGSFYPKGLPRARELEHASRQLTSIEINGTFYRHQSEASFAAWAEATPDDFVFSVKAHRATTHGKAGSDPAPAIEKFLASGITALGKKLGPILWQLPHNQKFDLARAEGFLTCLPKSLDRIKLRHAIEARHPSFDDPAWIAMLRKQGVASVIVDSDKQALRGDRTAGFVYARLQRNAGDAPEGYASHPLDAWAERFRNWASGTAVTDLPLSGPLQAAKQRPADCFVYFISGDKARAPDAARALLKRMAPG